jgi:biotin transport system substrate-specific component
MNTPSSSPSSPLLVPLSLQRRSPWTQALAVVLGSLVLALSSQLQVPMYPVPMTMQTFAVLLVAALYGRRLGTITVAAWLAEAMAGLPVLAGGAGGLQHFAGPTAGYLASFVPAAAFVGHAADRGWLRVSRLRGFGIFLAAHAFNLAMGWAWLTTLVGASKAFALGVLPFISGGVLKAALGVASLELARQGVRNLRR